MEKKTKLKRNKYFVGYKKLKNVKMFEEFSGGTELTEKESNFGNDLGDVFSDINILNLLWDEGYLAEDGKTLKDGVSYKDVNEFLEEELSQVSNNFTDSDFFGSNEMAEKWISDAMNNLKAFANKY